jgi:hypothetical protein
MLHAFRLQSLKVIEAVVAWRKHAYTLQQNGHQAYIKGSQSALPFIWEDTDYLLKMTTDTDWMRSSGLRRYFDFDNNFDPFMVKCSTPITNSQKAGVVVRGNSVQLPMHRRLMQQIQEAEAVLAEEIAADEARQLTDGGVVPEVDEGSHTDLNDAANPAQVGHGETKQEGQSDMLTKEDARSTAKMNISLGVSEENGQVKPKPIGSLSYAPDTVKLPKQTSPSKLGLSKPTAYAKPTQANEADKLADLLLQGLTNDFIDQAWLESVVNVQLNEEIRQASIRSQYKTTALPLDFPDEYVHIAFTPAIHSPNLYSGLNSTRLYSANESEAQEDDATRSFVVQGDAEGQARIQLSHIGANADFIYRMLKDYFALLKEPVLSSVQSLDDLFQTESKLTTPCWYWVVVNQRIGGVALFSLDPIAPCRRVELVHFSTIYLSLYKPCLAYFCDWLWSSDACEELRVRLVSGVKLTGEVKSAYEKLDFRAIQAKGSSGHRFVSLQRPAEWGFEDISFMSEVRKV